MGSFTLLSMPTEVIHHILTEVDALSLARLSQTCRQLNEFIANDKLLWREHYLSNFDLPVEAESDFAFNFKARFKELQKLIKLLQSNDPRQKRDNMNWIAQRIALLLQDFPEGSQTVDATENDSYIERTNTSRNANLLSKLFGPVNADNLLCGSDLFRKCGTEDMIRYDTPEERQNAAMLHVMYGVPVDPRGRSQQATNPYARSRVYDLRFYGHKSRWGPFRPDDSMEVDWENLESVIIVLGYNFSVFRERTGGAIPDLWDTPFSGLAPDAFPIVKEPKFPLEDPYGAYGTWMRVVCFLDYTDLYAFNFTDPDSLDFNPREKPREPLETEEAIRLITCKMDVAAIDMPTDPDDDPKWPVVKFIGKSRSRHAGWDPNANSSLRGCVRKTIKGDIRWTTWSIFHGEERWRSESIQIGGIRSARGIIGNWFDKDYDTHGPVGPTAFWKISNDILDDEKLVELPWM
ncbi:MAG: hypothetical protein M1820_008297 [Bogoriella megaspora]|nr:MAG: hypothetical protein M1820_008297 [Bogoriella megaspora]